MQRTPFLETLYQISLAVRDEAPDRDTREPVVTGACGSSAYALLTAAIPLNPRRPTAKLFAGVLYQEDTGQAADVITVSLDGNPVRRVNSVTLNVETL
jgi:hypothetical protein